MRLFWALLGLLVIAGAVAIWVRQPAPAAPQAAQPAPPAPEEPRVVVQDERDEPSGESAPPEPSSGPVESPETDLRDGSPAASDTATTPTEPRPMPPGPTPEDQPESAPAVPPEQQPAAPEPPDPDPAPQPLKIEHREDGSIMLDGRYLVRGEGTRDKPFQISWDLLISGERDYSPREGRTEIPNRLKLLDGKHIEITGNIAFPLLSETADELLVMLNQWDGCCIGVPPTPYDAVEVRLLAPADGKDRFATYGSIRGLFRIDPQLVGNWLVGLYVMDDASLKSHTYGGFAP